MCARSPLDRQSWISASESHPGRRLQNKRWLCLRFGLQMEALRFRLRRVSESANHFGADRTLDQVGGEQESAAR